MVKYVKVFFSDRDSRALMVVELCAVSSVLCFCLEEISLLFCCALLPGLRAF